MGVVLAVPRGAAGGRLRSRRGRRGRCGEGVGRGRSEGHVHRRGHLRHRRTGGSLLLAEPILIDPAYRVANDGTRNSSARTLERYRTPLEAAGLVLVDVRPATVLANNPMDARSRPARARYLRWWTFVTSRSKADARSARWLGPLVLGLDRVAMLTGQAPSTKFALFRRPAPEPRPVDVP